MPNPLKLLVTFGADGKAIETWVPMTDAEYAQMQTDNAAAVVNAGMEANAATLRGSLNARLALIRTARAAIAGGSIFATLTANEKAVIDGLLQDDLYLGRLVLDLFDAVT
jgi:hypothetical protein